MKWGIALNVHEKYEQTITISSQSDIAEIDYIWVVDFPAPRFAPSIAVKIASMTSRPRVGIGLLPSLIYSSEYIVRFVETLTNEFGNRFDILIGPGDKEALRSVGKKQWVPSKIVTETIGAAQSIKHTLNELGISCPVWVAAQGPRMIVESKKVDGVLLNLTDVSMVKWALEILGERDSKFRVGIFSPTKMTQSYSSVPPNDFLYSTAIVALGASRALMDRFDIKDSIESARRMYSEQEELSSEILEKIGIEHLLRWGFYSTPGNLVEAIGPLKESGVDTIIFGPPNSHSKSSAKLLLDAFQLYKETHQ
ncbi:MAG: hypothetical protein ACFFF4_01690 [Candidatus Thorarchaeota archaeon]